MPIISLHVEMGKLERIHSLIVLMQPLFNGEIVVDKEDKNIYRLVKTSKRSYFKVKQDDEHFPHF